MFLRQFRFGDGLPKYFRENADFPRQKPRQLPSIEGNFEGCFKGKSSSELTLIFINL